MAIYDQLLPSRRLPQRRDQSVTAQRQRGLTEQAADAAVDQACRMLRLPTIRVQLPEIADATAREQMSYRGSSLSCSSPNATSEPVADDTYNLIDDAQAVLAERRRVWLGGDLTMIALVTSLAYEAQRFLPPLVHEARANRAHLAGVRPCSRNEPRRCTTAPRLRLTRRHSPYDL